MKHCFKKFMALLLATLMVMSSFSTIAVFAQTDDCKHEADKWSVWAVNGDSTVAPKCTEPGYTWYRCECGKVEARDFVPALGHDLKWTATAESVEDVACGELYAIYLGCTRCNYVEEWAPTTNVPGYKTHSYTTYKPVETPTCLTYGKLVLICDNKDHDGAECPEIPVLIQRLNGNKGEHKFDKLVRKVDATCTDNGYELYECSLCYVKTGVKALGEDNAETYTKVINKLGHDLLKGTPDGEEIKDPATQEYNYVADDSCEVKCERCDHTETIHAAWEEDRKVVGKKPGSELSCYTADYCDRCKWEDPNKTAAHVIDKAKTTTRVDTVNHKCFTVYTCKDCEHVWEVVAVPGKDGGHKVYNEEGYVAPTCTEYGKVTWACLACGANGLEMLPIREHYLDTTKDLIVNGEKKADKATKEVITAGCERDGGTYVTCGYADCDYRTLVEGTFVSATGHNKVVDKVTPATCISPEIKTYKCANGCGKVYAPEYVGTPIPNAHPSACYEVATAPTCTTEGEAVLYCTLCSTKDKWIKYADKDAKDDLGNDLYPNFDFSKLLPFNHKFTNAHVSLLLTIAPNKDSDPTNDLTVGSSALYEAAYQAPTCTTDGFRKGSCYICNVNVNEVLSKGHSSENGYHDQHEVAADWYPGGYLTYDQAGNITGSYLRLPNGDHEAMEWYYCSACETNWTAKGEKGAHDDWYDGIKADEALGIEFVAKVDAECGKDGTYAHWIIPCNKIFQEIKKVVALPVRDNDGKIVRYDFDLNNDGTVDGTIGVDGTASGKVDAISWAVDADGYVRDENGYFEWYLVDVECHHVSVVYVDDNGAPIVDAKGNRITDGTIPALLHDWDEVDSKGNPAPNKRGYVAGFAADCTNDGVRKHWICGKCGAAYDAAGYYGDVNNDGKLDDEDWKIPALGHNMIDVEEKKATCTKPGYSAHKACNRNGCTYTEGKTDYQPLGHTVPAVVNQDNYCAHGVKAPTCVETGFGYGVLCSECGECAGNQYHTVIPALGHQYVDLTTNLAPTCTDPYFSISFCAICGHFENCAKADNAKFEEKTPACVLADTTPATFATLNALTQNVYGADYHSLTSYKYETVNVTYSFKANENLKKLFAKADANYTLNLIVNGKVVASQKLEYTTSAKTLAFELLNVVDNFSFAVNSTNGTLLDATGSIKVQFISEKTYGNREITNFKYWTEHTIQEGLKTPLEGNTYVADCVGYVQYTGCTVPGCGHIVEGSKQTVPGIGHDVADHKETVVTTEKLNCAICKRDVDAHENKYVITDMPAYIEPAQGDKAATHHVTTKYVLKACTECEFRTIEVDSVVEAEHDYKAGYRVETAASLTAPGVAYEICACGVERKVAIKQLSGTYLDLEIDNANKPGAGFTDSSIVAVTVKLSAADIAIWGINFQLTYDARYVEYLDGEEVWNSGDFKYGNSAVDVENTFAANHTGAKTNWVIVTAQAPNSADSKTQNIVVSGEQAFVTLYFKVNTPNNIDDVVFGFQNVVVINNGFVQKVDEDGELVFKADGVTPEYIPQKVVTTATGASIAVKKYMDHTGEGTVDLLDCLAAYQIYSGEILVPGDYSVTIDVNKDGVVDLLDFESIYAYISGNMSYEEIRNLNA